MGVAFSRSSAPEAVRGVHASQYQAGILVAPPQLPAHAPVLDVAHPVEVGGVPALGEDGGPALLHRLDGRPGQRLDPHEPLRRQARLDDGPAPLAEPDAQGVRLLGDEQPLRGEVLEHTGTRLEAVEPGVRPGGLGGPCGLVEDGDHLQRVPQPGLVVVEVVRRGHLHHPGAELRVHQGGVGDDRNLPLQQRQDDRLADQIPVARVVRVHRHRGVAEHRLRAGGGHGQEPVLPLHRVADLPDGPLPLLVLHLEVAERGPAVRAPVDQPAGAVEQPLLVQTDEHLQHRPRAALVHGEARAAPVEARPQVLVLLLDAGAVALLPLPDAAHELRPAEVVAGLSLGLLQLPLDHHLGGDAGVVHPRLPQGVEPAHPVPADEDVLQGGGERMPDVQRPGDVGWRQDDAVRRLARRGFRPEAAGGFPAPVPARLHLRRLVGLRKSLLIVLGHTRVEGLFSLFRPARASSARRFRERSSPRAGGQLPRRSSR